MAVLGQAYYSANPFEVNDDGTPLAAGQLFFYEYGTTTPLDTYQDPTLLTPNSNPIIADANGRFGSVWLDPTQAYTVQLWSAATPLNPAGSQIWSRGPFGPAAGGSIASTAGIVGEVRAFAGPSGSVPSGWLLCYGQAVSRTTYATLFSVLGTTWGAGDTTTTFNLPDLRGRGLFGKDDMGGSPASRITAGVSGIAGATLGATGGSQATQLHNHTLTDPQHTHTITDTGHVHQVQDIATGAPFTDSGTAAGHTLSAGPNTLNATTGIIIDAASTGITLANFGTGGSQNMPPAGIVNMIIYAGT